MALKGSLRQTKFDKLLLLHEFRIGAIVHDVRAEYWCRQGGVDFLGIEILVATIKDKIVSVDTKIARNLLTKKNERENISVLSKS